MAKLASRVRVFYKYFGQKLSTKKGEGGGPLKNADMHAKIVYVRKCRVQNRVGKNLDFLLRCFKYHFLIMQFFTKPFGSPGTYFLRDLNRLRRCPE